MTGHIRSRFLVAVAAVPFFLAACGEAGRTADTSGDTTTTTIERVDLAFTPLKAGKLTVCSDAPYEPFEFQDDNGKWTGFDMDLMSAIAARYGLSLEVTVQPFDGIWLAPAAKTCDVVASSMTITEDRKKNALFSDGYFDSYQSLLVLNENADTLTDAASLAGKTVAVQTGTTGEAYAQANLPDAKIQSFDDASAMFLALDGKQVDGILQDFPINFERAKKQGNSKVSIVFDEVGEAYGFAVAPDNKSLVDAINESLSEFRSTGVYDEIYAKYFGDDSAS